MYLWPIDTKANNVRTDNIRPESLRKGCTHDAVAVIDATAGTVQQNSFLPSSIDEISYMAFPTQDIMVVIPLENMSYYIAFPHNAENFVITGIQIGRVKADAAVEFFAQFHRPL